MSAMEQTTYRHPSGSNAWTFDESRRDPQHLRVSSDDDSVPLFLSELRDQPDPREFAPLLAKQRTSIRPWIVAGAIAGSVFAVSVAKFDSDVFRIVSDKTNEFMTGAKDQLPTRTENADKSASESGAPSRDAIVNAYQMALQSEVAAPAPTRDESVTPPKTLDSETLAALTTRAKSLLAHGDIGGARLLLERAANARDATAAFLLAQTYDPAVLGVRDPRSVTPDLAMARDWYRQAGNFGSIEAQQRLSQLGD